MQSHSVEALSMETSFIETPLLYSKQLTDVNATGTRVYLKLENVQPCNSFKIRGISKLCKKKLGEGYTSFVTFSGGNAGIALACTALLLKVPCHVVVPFFVSPRILNIIKGYGANVTIVENAQDAQDAALAMSEGNPSMAFVHPYDDPDLWDGYATIVDEVGKQLGGLKPSCFVVSVGGGGLLMGILRGLERIGWKDVPVVAMETIGAHSFYKSIRAGRIVTNVLTSVAKTLGAPSVHPTLMESLKRFKVISEIVSDKKAVEACLRFADDHTYLVEPACGASLAAVYSKLLPYFLANNGTQLSSSSGPVVIIVCGGSDTGPEILLNYAERVKNDYD